jgi:hypothetical protein
MTLPGKTDVTVQLHVADASVLLSQILAWHRPTPMEGWPEGTVEWRLDRCAKSLVDALRRFPDDATG